MQRPEATPVARWRARPRLATTLRVAAHGIPVAVSVAVVFAASSFVPPPQGSFARYAGWWMGLSVTATIVLLVAGRLSRRLLPLATLMRLSLVFPDGAPSRFRLARRRGTLATLEQRLDEARRGHALRTPVEAAELLLELVAHLDEHDALTRGHSERVRAYAQSIGRELGLGRRELDLLNWAALLHDVGKLEVPHEVLTKAGRPTDEEWQLLRRHPAAGAELAAPLRDWLGEWGAAIEEHHERWDGKGYPHGIAGTDISLAGRIVAVADVYDVITSSRSYKQAGSAAAAREELARCAGTQFDPAVVRAFLSMSVRSRGVVTGPLAWLAQAPVLARLPLTPAAGVVSAAAVAVGVPAVVTSASVEQVQPAPAVRVAAPAAPRVSVTPSAAPRPTRARATLAPKASAKARVQKPRTTLGPTVQTEATSAPGAETPPAPAEPPVAVATPEPPPSATPETPPPASSPSSQPARLVPETPALPVNTAPPPPGEVVKPVTEAIKPVTDVVRPVTDAVEPVVESVVVIVSPVTEPVVETLQPVTEAAQPVAEAVQPVTEAASELPVVGPLVPLLPLQPPPKRGR